MPTKLRNNSKVAELQEKAKELYPPHFNGTCVDQIAHTNTHCIKKSWDMGYFNAAPANPKR